MFKVILADDEPVIIKGLRKMISWEKLNAEIVGEAENGEELLRQIRSLSPDIVISDVSMPKMSGIDVIKELRQDDRKTKVIFLSGYQEFDYVKAAIRYEAQEYLLKPVGKEELEQAVLRAEQSLKKDNPMEYWQEEKNDIQTVFRKMNTETECKELYLHFQEMGLEIQGMNFTGVCFSIPVDFYKKIADQNMAELMRFAIFKKIQEYVKKEKNGFVIKREANSSNMILLSRQEDSIEKIEKEVWTIRDKIYDEYKVRLIVGVGNTVDSVKELKFAFKTAKFAAEIHYFTQQDYIRYVDIDREFHFSFEDYSKCYEKLVKSIFHRESDWIENLDETLKIVENLHYGNRHAAENRCIAMAMDLYREMEKEHLISPDCRQDYENFVSKIRSQKNYEELKKMIRNYLSDFIEKHTLPDEIPESQTIRIVKEYIREHYQENLNLNTLSEIVYMNPYYFSTFFKKETGQNFKNYLAEVRMEAAASLLREKDLKTYELAKAVGYHDIRSFTEKFKEYFGDSPSNYKKIQMKNSESKK